MRQSVATTRRRPRVDDTRRPAEARLRARRRGHPTPRTTNGKDHTKTDQPGELSEGTDGSADSNAPPDVVAALTVDLGGASTTTTSTTSPIEDPTDGITAGTGSAPPEFPTGSRPRCGRGREATTSWFSAGPNAGQTIYTWLGPPKPFTITSVTIVGNGQNADPANRKSFGFGHVDVVLLQAQTVVFTQGFDLPGTPDPTITVNPNVAATTIELTFTGHESLDCGGFAELQVSGF